MADSAQAAGLTVAVVDERNEPLCHMPFEAVRGQGLFYRSAALLLDAGRGKHVFRWLTGDLISLPVYGPVPGAADPGDFCAAQAEGLGIQVLPEHRRIKILSPCPQTDFSFCFLYKGFMAKAFPQDAEHELFAASLGDVLALCRFGCQITPICAHVYELNSGHAGSHAD